MDYHSWVAYTEPQKIDALRQEVVRLGNIVKYGVAGAGFAGTVFGSLGTVVLQHYWR